MPAYFAPGSGWAYPPYLYADTAPLQILVPDSCEESVRSGCYQRWSHDPARMATCVSAGYRGCGLQGLGADSGGSQVAIAAAALLVAGALAAFAL